MIVAKSMAEEEIRLGEISNQRVKNIVSDESNMMQRYIFFSNSIFFCG